MKPSPVLLAVFVVVAAVAVLRAWRRTQEPFDLGVDLPDLTELADSMVVGYEFGAVVTLRNLVSAQTQFQMTGRSDEDHDGIGEHGTFAELSGAVGVRGGAVLEPAVLGEDFQRVNERGEVVRGGYVFAIYLPGPGGAGVREAPGPPPRVDPELAERYWCCYAWPFHRGRTGVRTFFVNQDGDILATEDPGYDGPGFGPPYHAAFTGRLIAGETATDATGQDGNTWRRTN